MITFDLKTGYSCNNRCIHCVIDDSRDKLVKSKKNIDLTTEECIELIINAHSAGASRIVLTGGEITLRKDFPKILEKCRELNLSITLQTNGRQLSQKRIINAILSIDNITCVVAIHGSNATTHDLITKRKSSFEETITGIKTVIGSGKNVIAKVVISKVNMFEISSIIAMMRKLDVKHVCFAFPHGQGTARKNYKKLVPQYSNIQNLLVNAITLAQKLRIEIELEAVPFCIIPSYPKLVGELKYIYNSPVYFAQVHEAIENWDEIRIMIKKKSATCVNCFYDIICEGPWVEYIETYGDEELIPIKYSVEEKEKLQKLISTLK